MTPEEQVNDIRAFWKLVHVPGSVVELRIPDAGASRTVSGYYNDEDAFVRDVKLWNGKAPALYATLNPVRPDLLGRAANRAKPYAKHTTSDADILRLRRLLIDFDPVRPAGIGSTDEQHQQAIAVATSARAWLQAEYNASTILADSGNGSHLIFSVDLPNSPENVALLKKVLLAVAQRFDTDAVKIDLTTYNPARICKVYGSLVCKGDDMPDRPHRSAVFTKEAAAGDE